MCAVLVCMCTMCLQYPWMPEEGIGSGVSGSCEVPMWMLGIELRSPAKAASALNY